MFDRRFALLCSLECKMKINLAERSWTCTHTYSALQQLHQYWWDLYNLELLHSLPAWFQHLAVASVTHFDEMSIEHLQARIYREEDRQKWSEDTAVKTLFVQSTGKKPRPKASKKYFTCFYSKKEHRIAEYRKQKRGEQHCKQDGKHNIIYALFLWIIVQNY